MVHRDPNLGETLVMLQDLRLDRLFSRARAGWLAGAAIAVVSVTAGTWLDAEPQPAPFVQDDEEEEDGGDIVFHVESRSMPQSVMFSHQAHIDAGCECTHCHEGIFKQEFEGNNFKMADINKGQACGICHNANPATEVADVAAFPPRETSPRKNNCPLCHTLRIREPMKR